jgi:hypothetical protein
MTIDTVLPVPVWNFLFQMLTVCASCLVLWQIDTARKLDNVRHNGKLKTIFIIRRVGMFLKLLTMMWIVIYAHEMDWQIWPPMIAFMVAFNIYVVSEVLILRDDLKSMNGSSIVRSHG